MSIDCIGDFLTVIRNGVLVSKPFVMASYSKMRFSIASILKEEGFVKDIVIEDNGRVNGKKIKVILKYFSGESVIHEIKRMSKPSCRVYSSVDKLSPVIGGLGLSILSTSNGVISHKKAKNQNVGGEIICTVW